MADYRWRRVTQEEWQAFVSQFPDRISELATICEPPQTLIYDAPEGAVIAAVVHGDWPDGAAEPDWDAKVYRINEAVKVPQ